MNGNLGRDRLWNDHIWSEIDKAVREEVGRIRVAQKVFPCTVVNNVLAIPVTTVAMPAPGAPPAALRTADDEFQPFIEISREFVLTHAQVDGEENMHLATTLARMAASTIAAAEDALLFFGQRAINLVDRTGVTLTNHTRVQPGFVAAAGGFQDVVVPGALPNFLGDILTAVAGGMAALHGRAQPGPYALFLSPNRYAQTFCPIQVGLLQTPGDQINHVATGGFYMVNGLSDNTGILVSLGGEPVRIFLGIDATVSCTCIDGCGDHHLRVFERIQLMVRDRMAFQTLNFDGQHRREAEEASNRE